MVLSLLTACRLFLFRELLRGDVGRPRLLGNEGLLQVYYWSGRTFGTRDNMRAYLLGFPRSRSCRVHYISSQFNE